MDEQYTKATEGVDMSQETTRFQTNSLQNKLQASLGAPMGENSNEEICSSMDPNSNIRKGSLVDCEICCEEVREDEADIRRKINQKLIKNKNYFMEFVTKGSDQATKQTHGQHVKHGHSMVASQGLQLIDKRSRSETPDKMSATEVLFRAHQKLQMRRKESPQKLLEKHQQRQVLFYISQIVQKKAEELRAQIEKSKKKWYEKIKIRQEIARTKWKELLAERKAKLQDKLEQADERRETEISTLRNKAKQEIQKIDETNYIVKMTINNMKLDIDLKMNETQERRNQILEEHKKKQHDRHLKEEAAEKRRQEQLKETENKFLTKQQKREQADARRLKMLEEKRKAAQEYQKRIKVIQRKNDLGDRMSDVMSFVSNSENIWEFLGNERDWHELENHAGSDMIFDLIQKDYYELEKMKLKKDAEIINKMLVINGQGQIYAQKKYLTQIRKKKYYDNYTSEDDDESCTNEEREIFSSPERNTKSSKNNDTPSKKQNLDEEVKQCQDHCEQNYCMTEGSDKDSVADEIPLNYNQSSNMHNQTIESNERLDDSQADTNQNCPILTDEIQSYMLYSSRIKMSMKRNILKKNLSEDLTWADFLKNESYNQNNHFSHAIFSGYTRSMHSTPERKSEITNDQFDKENSNNEIPLNHNSNSSIASNIIKKQNSSKNSNGAMNQGSNPLNTSSSNLSEKSRISSVVYPSKKKKNPKNQTVAVNTQGQPAQNEMRTSGSLHSFKLKNSSGSNHSSTQSLHLQNTMANINIEPSRDQTNNNRKSVPLEVDSGRKRQTARMHSSSVQESSSGIPNISQVMNSSVVYHATEIDDKFFESQLNASFSHTGQQMSQLLTNSKPIMPMSKVIPKRLTANASKILYPVAQQKLLLKRPGKEGQFGKCKIQIRVEDLSIHKQQQEIKTYQQQLSFTNDSQTPSEAKQAQSSQNGSQILSNSLVDQIQLQESSGKKSQQTTPSFSKRRESTDTNNSNTNQNSQNHSQMSQSQTVPLHTSVEIPTIKDQIGTPTQQSKLWQLHQRFWEKLQNPTSQQLQQQTLQDNAVVKKFPGGASSTTGTNNMNSENSPSPKKDSKSKDGSISNLNASTQNVSQLDQSQIIVGQSNDQNYKDQVVKFILIENAQQIKTEDTQKTIFLDGDDSNRLIDYLEQFELSLRYCRLCEMIIPDALSNEAHIMMKSHKKTREELYIKEIEDFQFSILSLCSSPGDIEKELLKEKEKALKRKVKRLKAQMIAQAVSHETASYCPGKEFNSQNKKRFQILCIELEKQVIPIIKDYESLEATLKEIIKILDMRKQSDLHLIRKLKYIPILIEICKRISVCHKNEFKHLGRVLEFVIKIINVFCGLRENRNYMLQTNRMAALIELLNWCLNRPTQLFYGIVFMPQLFHILHLHVKHRAPYECQQMKEMFIEYLISSQITMKIKGKFQIINGPLDLSEMMGQVPLFLLKSATFLESLTNLISMDSRSRPLYEKSQKIGEHVLFVLQNTELFGIVPMIATILLTRNQPFKPSQKDQSQQCQPKILPQTILSLSITSIKIINNIYRMDYRFAQQMMSDFEIQEQLYHLFNFILYYTVETSDKQEDSKELLHETILLIGYFCLHNEKNQALLCKGENTLLQKLCNLPFPYFCDKKLKEILFPTLIQASYKNERSLAIMDQEISIEMLVDFIQLNMKEELPRIIEEEWDQQSMSSLGHSAVERKSHRSPSISSTNSSQCSIQIDMISGNSPFLPLYMRFPKKLWKDSITFYSKVLY